MIRRWHPAICRPYTAAVRVALLAMPLLACGARTTAQTNANRARTDAQVARTSWGRVIGRVYDAHTGRPIAGATVSVRNNGAFAAKGRTVGITDARGQYTVQAPLGRVSENFDLGRALNSGLAGLLLGGGTNRTKRIDVIRLDVQIGAEGCHPYSGPVSCRSADATRFEVTMEPVLLVVTASDEVSAPADGWGAVRIESAQITPEVALPRDKVVITSRIRMPSMDPGRDAQVMCVSATWGKKRMTPDKDRTGDIVTYRAALTAPTPKTSVADRMSIVIERSTLDMANGLSEVSIPFEIATSAPSAERCRIRLAARKLDSSEDTNAAYEQWQVLCRGPEADIEDLRGLANAAARIHRHDVAVDALRRVVALTGDRDRAAAMADHAQALMRSGSHADVIASYGPLLKSNEDTSTRTDNPRLLAALGLSYVATGALSEAREVLDRLLKVPGPLPDDAIELRDSLVLAEARHAVAKSPNDVPSLRRLGRALMDRGRYEEAVEPLKRAVTADPENQAARADLGAALGALSAAGKPAAADPAKAIEDAEAAVWLERGSKPVKSKDFGAWHRLARLLVAEAVRRGSEGRLDTALAARALEALEEAVRTGRAGARINEGIYGGPFGFLSARTVAVSGFAYPEAAWDYVAMESIRALQSDATDRFALVNLATAMVEMGAGRGAEPLLRHLSTANADNTEIDYLRAAALSDAGDRAGTESLLRSVLQRNPRHPRARVALARLLMERGDIASAAGMMAEHVALYGRGLSLGNRRDRQ